MHVRRRCVCRHTLLFDQLLFIYSIIKIYYLGKNKIYIQNEKYDTDYRQRFIFSSLFLNRICYLLLWLIYDLLFIIELKNSSAEIFVLFAQILSLQKIIKN